MPGTYYYGACVDGVQGETDRNNNCSQAIAITVQPPRVPDLMIGSVSVSKASVAPGEDFTLTTKVQNIGTGDARDYVFALLGIRTRSQWKKILRTSFSCQCGES